LVSTLLLLTVAMAAAVPSGLATAILLSEITRKRTWMARGVGISLDILAGVPSIVYGLFGNAFFSVYLGMGFSILSGGLTLACMVLPIFVRCAEAGLVAVYDDWRRGAAALGLSKTTTLIQIVLPAAAPAIGVGLVLGIGRSLAETAALIFTSGYVDRMPSSLWDSGRALSVHIYDLSMNVAGAEHNAYASALVLILLLLAINGCASWMTERLLHRRIEAL
jgi:phosphate transport system permease protein